ncbi:MAG: GNAT family N-acetyltransferase [Rhodothermales bacterium]
MANDFYIRDAVEADLRRLTEVELEAAERFAALRNPPVAVDRCLPHALLLEGIQQRRLWVAVVPGHQVVGFAFAGHVGDAAFLNEIDVLPAFGRRGIGRALIDRVERWARACGYERLALTTFRDIPWNGPYYAGLGFCELTEEQVQGELVSVLEDERRHVLAGWARIAMMKTL